MLKRDGYTHSLWQDNHEPYLPVNKPDSRNIFDIIIVGGGITGVSTAHQLQKAGKKCLIIEAYNLCFGTTGGTTAHLNTLLDTPYSTIEKNFSKEKARLYKTDENGFFKKEQTSQEAGKRYSNYSYLLDITYNNDRLFMNDLVYDYYYYRDNIPDEPKISSTVFLFTDRSLYRPGQTVYFKGIVLNKSVAEKKAWTNDNYQTTIYLRDANYQDIDTIIVKTNEYGSFSGKFQLPQTGLNNDFSIYTKKDNGNAGFKVEEYKRPKFYVDYDPLKGAYKVNDTIKVTGVAKAYAGNNIDGAMVKYRVVRQPRFIYPWLFWRGWFPPTAPMEIAHGEATTDKDGDR